MAEEKKVEYRRLESSVGTTAAEHYQAKLRGLLERAGLMNRVKHIVCDLVPAPAVFDDNDVLPRGDDIVPEVQKTPERFPHLTKGLNIPLLSSVEDGGDGNPQSVLLRFRQEASRYEEMVRLKVERFQMTPAPDGSELMVIGSNIGSLASNYGRATALVMTLLMKQTFETLHLPARLHLTVLTTEGLTDDVNLLAHEYAALTEVNALFGQEVGDDE